MSGTYSFIPGQHEPSTSFPLARFLPPYDYGIAKKWLRQLGDHLSDNRGWVLDPFGASPQLASEIVQSGQNLLVVSANPILQFLISTSVKIKKRHLYEASLAELNATSVGNSRFEKFINALYRTNCEQCFDEIYAKAFIWDRDKGIPIKKIYSCPSCLDSGEYPTTPSDNEYAKSFRFEGLHRSWIIERVVSGGFSDTNSIEDALQIYLPRALYAIFVVINALDRQTDEFLPCQTTLLISALDRTNNLWHYPYVNSRPKILSTPRFHYEYNLMNALEDAIDICAGADSPVSTNNNFTEWSEISSNTSGLCLYSGRFKALVDHYSSAISNIFNIKGVITYIPRYNQAFWALSALWASWIWGKEANTQFSSVIRRKRYDWEWHREALSTVFDNIGKILDTPIPAIGLINEIEPGFLSAVILGTQQSQLALSGMSTRDDNNLTQVQWTINPGSSKFKSYIENRENQIDLQKLIRSTAINCLKQHNEPVNYIKIHTAILRELALQFPIDTSGSLIPILSISSLHNFIQQVLLNPEDFIRYNGSSSSISTGLWWLNVRHIPDTIPHFDQIEIKILEIFQNTDKVKFSEIDEILCSTFPEGLAPELRQILLCLDSYGICSSSTTETWEIHDPEKSQNRFKDIEIIMNDLINLGKSLGYHTNSVDQQNVTWIDKNNQSFCFFSIITTTILADVYVQNKKTNVPNSFIVLPGSRVNLLKYKLSENPYLNTLVQSNWKFIKFRQIRKLATSPDLSWEEFISQIESDPLIYQDPQLPLF